MGEASDLMTNDHRDLKTFISGLMLVFDRAHPGSTKTTSLALTDFEFIHSMFRCCYLYLNNIMVLYHLNSEKRLAVTCSCVIVRSILTK